MKYLLYCVIRKPTLVSQAVSSIAAVSAVNPSKQYQFVVVTDMADLFKREFGRLNPQIQKQINIESISPQTISAWIGKNGYVFRVKIKALQYFFEKYREDVFLIDCDMYPKKPFEPLLEQIRRDRFVMFARYLWRVLDMLQSNPELMKKQGTFLSADRKRFEVFDGSNCYKILTDVHICLSSVVGMKYEHLSLIDEILTACDCLFEKIQIHTCEEIAIMLTFEQHGSIVLADSYFGTTRSGWMRLMLAYCCDVLSGEEAAQYQALVKDAPSQLFHSSGWVYSYDNYRLLVSAYLAYTKYDRQPRIADIITAGIESEFIGPTREDMSLMSRLYREKCGGEQ